MENRPFIGVASMAISDGIGWKLRIVKIASVFTAEALTIDESLKIIDLEQNYMFFRTRKAY
jgi:hypothetical protein